MKRVEKKLYIPLILIGLYLIASYLLYRYGCYIWAFRKDNRTLVFVIASVAVFTAGYLFAVFRKKKCGWTEEAKNRFASIPLSKILFICCIISIIIFLPLCKSYTNSWYPPIFKALSDPKGVYYTLAEVAKNRTGVRIIGVLDVFPYMILPLTLYGWDKISKKLRAMSFILAIGYLMVFISSGRNISVAVQALSVVAVWLSVVFGDKSEIYRTSVIRITVLSVLYCVLVVSFFGLTISSRSGYNTEVAEHLEKIPDVSDAGKTHGSDSKPAGSGKHEAEEEVFIDEFADAAEGWDPKVMGQYLGIGTYEYHGLEITEEQLKNFNKVYKVFPNYTDIWSKSYVNTNDPVAKMLPGSLKNLYVSVTSYITNGYNCLTVALHTEHQWTYGIGHSSFLSAYADSLLGTDATERTYYSRLTNDETYPLVSKSFWPSTYVQLADDLTFPGVVLFMGLAGFVISHVLMSVIKTHKYWGVLLLGQLELWAFFIPANNILENSGGFFVTFWFLFIAWILTQVKISRKIQKKEEP